MKFEFKNESLKKIEISKNKFLPIIHWGFEMGNWYSFFSLEKRGGLNSKIEDFYFNNTKQRISYQGIIVLKKGKFSFVGVDFIQGKKIIRNIDITALKNSFLGDFAFRMAIEGKEIIINDRKYKHKGKNLYKALKIPMNVKYENINFSIKQNQEAFGFENKPYIRDERPNRWILHQRIVSNIEDEIFVKYIKNNKIKKNSILIKETIFKKFFYYIRERRFAWFPFQVCSNTMVEEGSKIKFFVEIDFGN